MWEQKFLTEGAMVPATLGSLGLGGRAPAHLSVDGLDLLQGGQHEDCRLAHSRLGLAQDIHAQDGLGNTLMLD